MQEMNVEDYRGLTRLRDEVEVNGVRISGAGLVMLLNMVTDPNPKMWYRFERKEGDTVITVHSKYDDDFKEKN